MLNMEHADLVGGTLHEISEDINAPIDGEWTTVTKKGKAKIGSKRGFILRRPNVDKKPTRVVKGPLLVDKEVKKPAPKGKATRTKKPSFFGSSSRMSKGGVAPVFLTPTISSNHKRRRPPSLQSSPTDHVGGNKQDETKQEGSAVLEGTAKMGDKGPSM
ncbi:hypothetical protein HN51_048703 [Arachis hypogaea]